MSKARRLSLRVPIFIASSSAAASVAMVAARWLFLHWADPDLQQRLVNFGAAWIPFVVSIILAWLPDWEKKRKASMMWRAVIVIAGLAWSVILWRQQTLSLESSRRDQQQLLDAAIEKSNQHSDAQITQVRKELETVNKHSYEETKSVKYALKTTTDTLTGALSKTASDLGQTISKTPIARKAILQFTFPTLERNTVPIRQISLSMTDGVVKVPFTFGNISDESAIGVEIWVKVCDGCRYAKEPEGFTHLRGADEHDRYRTFGTTNPDVFFEVMSVEVTPPLGVDGFDIALRSACQNCVVTHGWENFHVTIHK